MCETTMLEPSSTSRGQVGPSQFDLEATAWTSAVYFNLSEAVQHVGRVWRGSSLLSLVSNNRHLLLIRTFYFILLTGKAIVGGLCFVFSAVRQTKKKRDKQQSTQMTKPDRHKTALRENIHAVCVRLLCTLFPLVQVFRADKKKAEKHEKPKQADVCLSCVVVL